MWKLATSSLLDLRVCKDSKLINDALKNSLVNLRAIRTVKEKRRRKKKSPHPEVKQSLKCESVQSPKTIDVCPTAIWKDIIAN